MKNTAETIVPIKSTVYMNNVHVLYYLTARIRGKEVSPRCFTMCENSDIPHSNVQASRPKSASTEKFDKHENQANIDSCNHVCMISEFDNITINTTAPIREMSTSHTAHRLVPFSRPS